MAVPPVVLFVPKFLVLNQFGIYDSYTALVLPLIVDAAGVFIMLAVAGYGFWAGGWSGIFYALIGFGIILFIWYAATDAVKGVDNYIRGPRKLDVTLHQGDSTKGTEYPDIEGRA